MHVPGLAVAWIFAVLAIPVAFATLFFSGPSACGQMQGAFRDGVTTESSTTLEVVADHCTITRNSDGAVRELTIVNWSGMLASVAVLLAAWFLGALLGRHVPWRRGLLGMAAAGAVFLAAMLALFV